IAGGGSSFGANLIVASGTLTNAAGALLTVTGADCVLGAVLDNRGTVTLASDLTLAAAAAQHHNSGTINLAGGGLTVSQSGTAPSFTSSGAIVIGAGTTLTVTGGTFGQQAGSISGNGTLALTVTTA